MDHVHNPSSVKDISGSLDEILDDGGIRCVVLSSKHAKNWCIGLDIPWIMQQYKDKNREAMKEFFVGGTKAIFLRLLEIPLVTIAAINGHTYGNGVMVALHCDLRFMRSDRGYFYLPEAEMGFSEDVFTPSGIRLMDVRYDSFIREVMIPTAKKITAAELLDKKIIDHASTDREAVLSDALARAVEISSSEDIYCKILENRKIWSGPVIDAIKNEDEAAFDNIIEMFWNLMVKMGVA